jgi:SAM-dependent methyltransferase
MNTEDRDVAESHDLVQAKYDEWSDWYPYIYGGLEQGFSYFHATFANTLKQHLGKGRVLDVGCGVGLSTGGLARAGFELTAFDLSGESVRRAQTLLQEHADIEIEHCDIFDYQPTELFDAAIAASGFLEHFLSADEQQKAVERILGFVRPGGVVMLDCYDQEELMHIEPDKAISHVISCKTESDDFIYLETRSWNGFPRSKWYDATYYRIPEDGHTQSLSVPGLAVTLTDMEGYFMQAGASDLQWVSPSSSGYHKHLCVVRRPESKLVSPAKPAKQPIFLPEKIVMPPYPGEPEPDVIYPEDLLPNPFEEAPSFQRHSLVTHVNKSGHQVIERYKQVTLVMLSGGIDSVYTLQKLLRESRDEIIAHHIDFINLEGRADAEAQACRKIIQYLKREEREFFFTESLIDRHKFKAFGGDDMAVSFEVGVVAQSYHEDCERPIDRWTAGICMEEELEDYNFLDELKTEHMLNAAAAGCFPGDPPRFFQLSIIPKKEQMEYMGQRLVDMCWTCRKPELNDNKEWLECGVCKTCLLMGKIRRGEKTLPKKPDSG